MSKNFRVRFLSLIGLVILLAACQQETSPSDSTSVPQTVAAVAEAPTVAPATIEPTAVPTTRPETTEEVVEEPIAVPEEETTEAAPMLPAEPFCPSEPEANFPEVCLRHKGDIIGVGKEAEGNTTGVPLFFRSELEQSFELNWPKIQEAYGLITDYYSRFDYESLAFVFYEETELEIIVTELSVDPVTNSFSVIHHIPVGESFEVDILGVLDDGAVDAQAAKHMADLLYFAWKNYEYDDDIRDFHTYCVDVCRNYLTFSQYNEMRELLAPEEDEEQWIIRFGHVGEEA